MSEPPRPRDPGRRAPSGGRPARAPHEPPTRRSRMAGPALGVLYVVALGVIICVVGAAIAAMLVWVLA